MRSVILNFIKSLKLKNFTLTEQLPWEDNGAPLYHHNKRHIYVATANTQQLPMIDAFDRAGTVDEITKVSVYFVNDAKKLPENYDDVCNQIAQARLATGTEGYVQRTVNVTSQFVQDEIVTQFEFSFRRLITN